MNLQNPKIAWFETIVEPHAGDVPSRRSQRSENEVNGLKTKAEAKRQMKRNKRINQFN